mgnify:CR=1 FL=1
MQYMAKDDFPDDATETTDTDGDGVLNYLEVVYKDVNVLEKMKHEKISIAEHLLSWGEYVQVASSKSDPVELSTHPAV